MNRAQRNLLGLVAVAALIWGLTISEHSRTLPVKVIVLAGAVLAAYLALNGPPPTLVIPKTWTRKK